eukprot:7266294-Ditylum_brightwellii.AAC.1
MVRQTTSPSGQHLGHFKALFSMHQHDMSTDEGQQLERERAAIIDAYLSLTNYTLSRRYAYQRWKNVVNVMIKKIPGNHHIHKLRVIHIYEANYVIILSVLWRKLVASSEQHQTLYSGQFGGRQGKDAHLLTLIEELKYDIYYASRKDIIKFDNDAASCYNRIIPSLASLIARKKGMHKSMTFVHATSLQEARFKLKTVLGVSEAFYQYCQAFPIYSTGQESTNSPTIWLFISSTLFDIHEANAHGATFKTPDKETSVSLSMVGFVDNS